jgi:hypothetical protein
MEQNFGHDGGGGGGGSKGCQGSAGIFFLATITDTKT